MNVSFALSKESKHCSASDAGTAFCKKINLKAVSHIYIILNSSYIKKKNHTKLMETVDGRYILSLRVKKNVSKNLQALKL